jgi:hypothetical protein
VNVPKKERKEEREGITKEQNERKEERKDNKHNLLYEHRETGQAVGIQSQATSSSQCTHLTTRLTSITTINKTENQRQ